MSARISAILQLCFAFSLILWVLCVPFTVEYFETRSGLLLFQTATGKGNRFVPQEKLARHALRFATLPEEQQRHLLKGYQQLEEHVNRPALAKMKEALQGLLLNLSPFTQAWIFFSIITAVLVLREKPGARASAWLLPILVLCYGLDTQHVTPPTVSPSLLPTEEQLLREYPSEQLLDSWQRYLVQHWTQATPSPDPSTFSLQVESGEHALTVARTEEWIKQHRITRSHTPQTPPWPLLLLYLTWNLIFALVVNGGFSYLSYLCQAKSASSMN